MPGAQCRSLILACAAACSSAAAFQATGAAQVNRLRDHMREYVAHLPDYTSRITLERFRRVKPRADFELNDRLRLEVAYTSGQELYSWPGDARFESGIEDLLPGHGMVSNGSYALHVKNLFVREVAQFGAPKEEKCDDAACVRLDFEIPMVRSGYALSTGSGSAPVPLVGSAWFDAATLDILRLEVRVDDPPRSVRVAATRETTVYRRARIGDVEFVVPGTSELMLRDRDGSEMMNRSTFDQYHRYAGSATVFYGAADVVATPQRPEGATTAITAPATLDEEIGEDAAIGDPFTVTTKDGQKVTGRISDMRRAGKFWLVELKLPGGFKRGTRLPVKPGFRVK
ncbi:MAG: hypothetical protein ABI806_29080 [Candidatus Solibacter sp.]